MKVSVLITTYNHESFIEQAVESVLQQRVTFPFEILIGEDCSTDRTRAIVTTLHGRHPELIRLVLPDRNLGEGGNPLFREVLEFTKGEYVAWLDGDDYWTEPEKLQRQVDFLDAHPECTLCFHAADNLRPDGSRAPFFEYEKDRSVYSLEDIILENFIPSPSVVHRNGMVEGVPADLLRLPGDWAMNILHAERGHIGFLNGVWAIRRVHPGGWISMRSNEEKMALNIGWLGVIDEHLRRRFHARIEQRVADLNRWLDEARAHETRR